MDDVTFEEFDGETPNGGVKSLWMYSDANGNPVAKGKAERCEIHEIDKSGTVVFRTYGEIENVNK